MNGFSHSTQLPDASDADKADAPAKELLAGLALRNGVVVIGKSRWGAAIRGTDGEIHAHSGSRGMRMPQWVDRIPLAGPLARVTEQMLLIPRIVRAVPQAQLPMLAPAALISSVGGAYLAQHARRRFGPGITAELLAGTASIMPMLVGLKFDRVARYHGAEHKTIAGYEQGIPAAEASRIHPRCGTTLAVPALIASAAARAALGPKNPAAAVLGTAAALELVRAAVRNPQSAAGRSILTVGMTLQRFFTTAEPRADELEVGGAAMDAALDPR